MPDIQSLPIADIRPYEKNQKKHPKDQVRKIADSIQEFGFNQPIVVDQDKVILVGHGRFFAAQELGLEEVPVIVLEHLTEEQRKAYRLADNKLNESDWDMDLVVTELRDLSAAGFNIDLTGFGRDLISKDPDEKDDFVPAPSKEAKATRGDIFKLGRHVLMCGDSTSPAEVDRLMEGSKAQMVFTDPPYNVDYGSALEKKREGIMNDKMTDAQFAEFLEKVCSNLVRVTEGGIYICMASKELPNVQKAFVRAGGHWSSTIVWVKNTFSLTRNDYQWQHKPILYGWPEGVKNHYFIGYRDLANVWENLDSAEPKFDGEYTEIKLGGAIIRIKGKSEGQVMRKRVKFDIWRYQKPSRSDEHPTMKPVALCIEAIINSSKVGDTVLDLFGGSGSTLIACEKTNRVCRMMELDPKYVDTIVARYEEFTGDKAEKLSTPPALPHSEVTTPPPRG